MVMSTSTVKVVIVVVISRMPSWFWRCGARVIILVAELDGAFVLLVRWVATVRVIDLGTLGDGRVVSSECMLLLSATTWYSFVLSAGCYS